eukprot:1161541-Pelagomonas_calceolata.AAC.1
MAGVVGSAEAEAAVREQLHDKLLPVVLALLRVDRLSGEELNVCQCVNNEVKKLLSGQQEGRCPKGIDIFRPLL